MYITNRTTDQKIIIQTNKTTAGDAIQIQNTNGNLDLLKISNTGILTTVNEAITTNSIANQAITADKVDTSFINQNLTQTSTPTFANVISNNPQQSNHLTTKNYVDTQIALVEGGGGTTNTQMLDDTYGAQQVATKQALIDMHFDPFTQGNNENSVNKYTVGNGTVTYDANSNSLNLNATTTGDIARIRSQNCVLYQSANTLWCYFSTNFNPLNANTSGVEVRIGFAENNAGIFLRYKDGVLSFNIRHKNSSGVVVINESVNSSAFTVDKLDGTGPSGIVFDPTKQYLFAFQCQFLYSGSVTAYILSAGAIQEMTTFYHSGISSTAYIQNANLPFSTTLELTQSKTYRTNLGCASIQYFGQPPVISNLIQQVATRTITSLASNTSSAAIILRTVLNNNIVFRNIYPHSLQITCSNSQIVFANIQIVRNESIANFTNTSFTNINSTYSVLQTSTAATQTYTGTKAQSVSSFYISGSNTQEFRDDQISNLVFGCYQLDNITDYIIVNVTNVGNQATTVYITLLMYEAY